jgi:hypothetical protein
MKKIILPRGYISYSQYTLWRSSKAGYISRYFKKGPELDSAELRFGKYISWLLENDPTNPLIAHVPRYATMEHRMLVKIGKVAVKGGIDTFNPITLAFREYKTGIICPEDCTQKHKVCVKPWDQVMVRRHKQLPWYCMMVRAEHGKYNAQVFLDHIPTRYVKTEKDARGIEWTLHSKKIEMEGEVRSWKRIIAEWELDALEKDLLVVAREISEAYQAFLISDI